MEEKFAAVLEKRVQGYFTVQKRFSTIVLRSIAWSLIDFPIIMANFPFIIPELSYSIGSQKSISYILKKYQCNRSLPNGLKTFLVIPAFAGIQDGRYFWIPAFAGMTDAIKSIKNRSI